MMLMHNGSNDGIDCGDGGSDGCDDDANVDGVLVEVMVAIYGSSSGGNTWG